MMIDKYNALEARKQIKDYYIIAVEYVGMDVIIYRAENMKHNREVWLYEYFPVSIAKRHQQSDEQFIVYVHPTQSELFHLGKTEFKNLYNNLKILNHPSIPVVYEVFESCGTVFASTKYNINTTTLRSYLNNDAKVFLEQQIGTLALSIVRAFVILQQYGLQIYLLNPETLLIDNTTQKPIVAYAQYMSFNEELIQSSIYELGKLLYEMMDKENFNVNEPLKALKPSKAYSAALCGLVNRMITSDVSKHFKTFQELQTLLLSYESSLVECEHIVCERIENKLSSYFSLASVILVIVFAYYIFTKSNIDVKNLTWFDSMRYHLAAYFGNVEGQRALAEMYEKGYYVDANIKEAIVWYKKVAQEGDVDAELNLAYIYKTVESVKDDEAAFKILSKLASNGNLYAQKTIAYNFMQGEGGVQDYKQAMYWFKKAYTQGDAYSCGAIGWMYASGHGVEKDLIKALDWFQKGIDRNDTYFKKEFVK